MLSVGRTGHFYLRPDQLGAILGGMAAICDDADDHRSQLAA